MKLSPSEQRICDVYSRHWGDGKIHCDECPLVVDQRATLCRANAKWNEETGEWESDDGMEHCL